jgi:hypothetical protein
MVKLSYAISKVMVDVHGQREFLRRLSDPLWFQAFGCVLGFDWHSSGVTTVVTGVLKQSLSADVHGVAIAGGKGKKATSAMYDIPKIAESFGFSDSKIESLMYASKMSAKVDSAAVQDGYSLYHHTILFDEKCNWAVVQQGMNSTNRMARRYHWISDSLKGYVSKPHAGIICEQKTSMTLDMTALESVESQKVALDVVCGDPNNLRSSIYKLSAETNNNYNNNTLDSWFQAESASTRDGTNNSNHASVSYKSEAENPPTVIAGYEMPRRLDWGLYRRIYDIQPKNYEEFLAIPGVGAATVRALALVAELIYGTAASWEDPVKYSFAHGGKDGVPHPVARKVYDQSIKYLEGAIDGSELDRQERTMALQKLARFSDMLFSFSPSRDKPYGSKKPLDLI